MHILEIFSLNLNWVCWLFKIELQRTELHETETLFLIHVFIYPFVYLKLIEALLHPDVGLDAVTQI